jgi:hypothetical protein
MAPFQFEYKIEYFDSMAFHAIYKRMINNQCEHNGSKITTNTEYIKVN